MHIKLTLCFGNLRKESEGNIENDFLHPFNVPSWFLPAKIGPIWYPQKCVGTKPHISMSEWCRLKGTVHPKLWICLEFTVPQTKVSLIRNDLEKSNHSLTIDPLEWMGAVRMRINYSFKLIPQQFFSIYYYKSSNPLPLQKTCFSVYILKVVFTVELLVSYNSTFTPLLGTILQYILAWFY